MNRQDVIVSTQGTRKRGITFYSHSDQPGDSPDFSDFVIGKNN